MQRSRETLGRESMHVEQCGGTASVDWTGAAPVTALLSTAALAHCMMGVHFISILCVLTCLYSTLGVFIINTL